MRARVALVIPSLAGGGAEKVMLTLAGALDAERFEPVLVVLDGKGELKQSVPEDVEIVNLGTSRLRYALSALTEALGKIRPGIVLSTMGYLNLALLAFVRPHLPGDIRYLVREANTPAATLAAIPFGPLGRAAGQLAYRTLYRRADTVICNSRTVAAELRSLGIDPGRIAVVDNPVDVDGIRARVDFTRPRALGRRFVAAGRLTHQKGFDLLPPWFARMPEDCRLTILGDGPMRAELERARAAHGLEDRVDLPGFDTAPWQQISEADAFLMPSRWEGMPNAALEALALGTPVIAARAAGGLPELTKDVPAGSLVIADGEEDFIAAMRVVPSRPERGWEAPSVLPPRFESPAVVARYASLIDGEAAS